MSRIIGLTGPTGAGKSTATAVAGQFGVTVVDCDKVARLAVEPGMPGLEAVRQAFGPTVLTADGRLDRKALAATAFSSPERTELLNRTLLPHIVEALQPVLKEERVLLDAPTLFESGLDAICHATVAVLAPKTLRLRRIIERDRLTLKEADLRLSAGKPDRFYREKADHILYNDSADPAGFLAAAESLFCVLFKEK